MRNTRSLKATGDAVCWARRHREQKGKPLDPRTTRRFGFEFEKAVEQRGQQAKEASNGS